MLCRLVLIASAAAAASAACFSLLVGAVTFASSLVSQDAVQIWPHFHVAPRPCLLLHAHISAVPQASKLMPPSSSLIVRTLQQDHYYAPLLVLMILVTIAAVSPWPDDHAVTSETLWIIAARFWLFTLQRMARWCSMKLFQNN